MATATLFCLLGITMITVCSINSKPEATQIVQDVTKPVETVAMFDPYNAANASQLIMTQDNSDTWGAAPGSFNSTFVMDLTLSSFKQEADGNGYRIQKTGEWANNLTIDFNMTTRAPIYDNITWGCDTCKREVVDVLPRWTYALEDELEWDTEIETLNWGALTSYYKLSKAPLYKAAWRILAQITDKMYTQSFQTFYYALVLEQVTFNDMDTVTNGTLNFLGNYTLAQYVYNDAQFGFGNAKALTYWVCAALFERSGVAGPNLCGIEITTHFNYTYGILMDSTQISTIVGEGSLLMTNINTLETNLTSDGLVNTTAPISATTLACTQWASRTLLGSTLNGLVGQQMNIETMLDMGMDFMVVPEFSGTGIFTPEEAEILISQNHDSDNCILNPLVMYNSYFADVTGVNQTIMTQTQWYYFKKYLDIQLESQNQYQAEGQLMAKTVSHGYQILNATLVTEYATRNLAHVLNYGSDHDNTTYPCSYFVDKVGENNATLTAEVCGKYDFSSLADVRYWVNADWYSQDSEFANATGLSAAQTTAMFNVTEPYSFGAFLKFVMAREQTVWNCNSFNCTSLELVWRQYGQSNLTMNPIFTVGDDLYFIPPSFSIYNWGLGQTTPGVEGPPELYAYFNFPYTLDEVPDSLNATQISKLLSLSYSWYGLSNNYNMMQLYTEYATQISQGDNPSAYWSTVAASLNVTDNSLTRILQGIEWQTTQLLFEGLVQNLTARQMVYPWFNNQTDVINSGERALERGVLFIDPLTTPVINNVYGPTALRSFTVLTGVNYDKDGAMFTSPDTVGQIREVDDGAGYIWLREKVWDGDYWNEALWYDESMGLQYSYDPGFPNATQYDLKMPLQNSPQLEFQSSLNGFSLDYFTGFTMQQEGITTECVNDYNPDQMCTQTARKAIYSTEKSSSINKNIAGILQLPLKADQEYNLYTFDEQTGYTRHMTHMVEYQLTSGDFFFLQEPYGVPDQTNPMVAKIRTYYDTNSTSFYETYYPRNGTLQIATGETETVDGPVGLRKPMQVVWITIGVMILILAIVAAVAFLVRHLQDGQESEATEPLNQQVKDKKGINVSQSNSSRATDL